MKASELLKLQQAGDDLVVVWDYSFPKSAVKQIARLLSVEGEQVEVLQMRLDDIATQLVTWISRRPSAQPRPVTRKQLLAVSKAADNLAAALKQLDDDAVIQFNFGLRLAYPDLDEEQRHGLFNAHLSVFSAVSERSKARANQPPFNTSGRVGNSDLRACVFMLLALYKDMTGQQPTYSLGTSEYGESEEPKSLAMRFVSLFFELVPKAQFAKLPKGNARPKGVPETARGALKAAGYDADDLPKAAVRIARLDLASRRKTKNAY